jgi:hypothetical protein
MREGDIQSAARDALIRILRPLTRLLLEVGLGVGDLHVLSKLAYVEAAGERQAGRGGARPNVSRIAAATGLTRQEVATILRRAPGELPPVRRGRARAERVLTAWHTDPEFSDRSGSPRPLPKKGGRGSFAALVKRYGGAVKPASILRELVQARAAREMEDGRVEATSRTCANVHWDAASMDAIGAEISEHCETLLYNLEHPDAPRYARRVECANIDVNAMRLLVPQVRESADDFLEGAQVALSDPQYRANSRRTGEHAVRFVVSVQFFQKRMGDERVPRAARRLGQLRSNRRSRIQRRKARREVGAD